MNRPKPIPVAEWNASQRKTHKPVKAKASNLTGFEQSELERVMDMIVVSSVHGEWVKYDRDKHLLEYNGKQYEISVKQVK